MQTDKRLTALAYSTGNVPRPAKGQDMKTGV